MDSIRERVVSEVYHTNASKEDESCSKNDAASGDENFIGESTLGGQGNINMGFFLPMSFENARECFEQAMMKLCLRLKEVVF